MNEVIKMNKVELDIQTFANDDNEEKKYYGVNEDYNKIEVYSKEDVDNKKQKKILTGTSRPSDSLGEDGDIYLQYG